MMVSFPVTSSVPVDTCMSLNNKGVNLFVKVSLKWNKVFHFLSAVRLPHATFEPFLRGLSYSCNVSNYYHFSFDPKFTGSIVIRPVRISKNQLLVIVFIKHELQRSDFLLRKGRANNYLSLLLNIFFPITPIKHHGCVLPLLGN